MSLGSVFSYNALVHAIAGTAGGSSAMSLFYPLDMIRTTLQVSSGDSAIDKIIKLIEDEGLGYLYRGLGPMLISLGFSNFVYFYSNNALKAAYMKFFKSHDVPIVPSLIIASLAGVINVFTTCPLWVANTRLKLQRKSQQNKYKGLFNSMKLIAKEEGIISLWNGCLASLVLVSNPTIHFVAYDKIKEVFLRRAMRHNRNNLTNGEIFIIGAIAKAIATVITYPIQVAQTNMRYAKRVKEGEKSDKNYKGVIDCLIKIFKKDGFLGWYKGLSVKLVQTVLTTAFQFLAYERIKGLIFAILGGEKQLKLVS